MAYIMLALSTLIPAVWLFLRRRDPVIVATYMFAAGVITSADYLALGVFDLYHYHTGLVGGGGPNNIVGVILAEWLFVPSLIVATEPYLQGLAGVAFRTWIVVFVELLFLRMGLFEHLYWSTWYTMTGFAVYLWLVDRFWQEAHQQGLAAGWPLVAYRLMLAVIWWAVPTALTGGLFHVMITTLHLLPQYWPNQALGYLLTNGLAIGPVFIWVIMGGNEARWSRCGVAAIGMALLQVLMQAIGWRVYRAPWGPLQQSLAQTAGLTCACLIDTWVHNRARSGQGRRLRPRKPVP